jgi:hypothetical protein
MNVKTCVFAASAALAAVFLWSTVGNSQTALVCEGEFDTFKRCSGADTIQGIPIDANDCTNTCENHPSKQIPCGTLGEFEKKLCGNKTPIKTGAFPSAEGNKCGYGWYTISCQ